MKYLLIFFLTLNINFVYANQIGKSTGYKIPRYVSTKSNESNLRIGAGTDYPILLTYTLENLPLEIIDEYQQWRKIIDIEGNQGWIHESLLKGNRYGIINTQHNKSAQIFKKPEGKLIGKIGNKNIVKINICIKLWCFIKIKKNTGWINKNNLWGVYKKEEINVPFYQPLINQFWKIF